MARGDDAPLVGVVRLVRPVQTRLLVERLVREVGLQLAVPLWLLYELGIVLARFVEKPAGVSDYTPPGDAEMERELDKSEADSNKAG